MNRQERIWTILVNRGIVDKDLPNYYKGQGWPVEVLLGKRRREYNRSLEYLKRFDNPNYTGSDLDMGSNRATNLLMVQKWVNRDKAGYKSIEAVFDEVSIFDTGFAITCNKCGSHIDLEHKMDQKDAIILLPGYECVIITCEKCKQEIVIGGEPEGDE